MAVGSSSCSSSCNSSTAAAAAAGPSSLSSSSSSSSFGTSRTFLIAGTMRFRCRASRRQQQLLDSCLDCIHWAVEGTVWLIGPVLIVFALGITAVLSYSFFTIVLPMLSLYHAASPYKMPFLGLHCSWVIFVLVNVLYNYGACVMTRNSGPAYHKIVRELATATDFAYPETPTELEQYRRDFEDRMVLRMRRRQARAAQRAAAAGAAATTASSTTTGTAANGVGAAATTTTAVASSAAESGTATTTTTAAATAAASAPSPHNNNLGVTHRRNAAAAAATTTTKITQNVAIRERTTVAALATGQPQAQAASSPIVRRWMLLGPMEWGYCGNSHQPKPPRSHYDHVTKRLVLNLDHYCPWMFNAIGYFNYRYFVNFLLYIFIGMIYGAAVTFRPFMMMSTPTHRQQWKMELQTPGRRIERLHPFCPYKDEKLLITLCFLLSVAVGAAVALLAGFHVYLACTAQTTIEFHGNWANKRRAAAQGQKWKNPYSLGSAKQNWKFVYGTKVPWYLSLLPSSRSPEFLPVPVPGYNKQQRKLQQQQELKPFSQQQQRQQHAAASLSNHVNHDIEKGTTTTATTMAMTKTTATHSSSSSSSSPAAVEERKITT